MAKDLPTSKPTDELDELAKRCIGHGVSDLVFVMRDELAFAAFAGARWAALEYAEEQGIPQIGDCDGRYTVIEYRKKLCEET